MVLVCFVMPVIGSVIDRTEEEEKVEEEAKKAEEEEFLMEEEEFLMEVLMEAIMAAMGSMPPPFIGWPKVCSKSSKGSVKWKEGLKKKPVPGPASPKAISSSKKSEGNGSNPGLDGWLFSMVVAFGFVNVSYA